MFHRKLIANPTTSPSPRATICSFDQNCHINPKAIILPPPSSPPPSIDLTPYIVLAFIILGSLVLMILCYILVNKFCKSCTLFGRQSTPEPNPPSPAVPEDNESQIQGIINPELIHPIWLIQTPGLGQDVIDSIKVIPFKKLEGLIEGTGDCPICLSEFIEDVEVRLLPKCNHAFHVDCIDTWLEQHTNCPVCRGGIVSNRPSWESSRGSPWRWDITQLGIEILGRRGEAEASGVSEAAGGGGGGDDGRSRGNQGGGDNEIIVTNNVMSDSTVELAEEVNNQKVEIKVDIEEVSTSNGENSSGGNQLHYIANSEVEGQLVKTCISMQHFDAHLGSNRLVKTANASGSNVGGSTCTVVALESNGGSTVAGSSYADQMESSSSWCGRVSSARYGGQPSSSKLSP